MMPTKVLLEGTNKNLIVFTYKNLATQKFEYDEVNQTWKNIKTQNAIMLEGANFKNGANIVTGKFTNEAGQKFTFDYCENHDEGAKHDDGDDDHDAETE